MAAIGHCLQGGADAPVPWQQRLDEDAADEIAMALTMSHRAGQSWLHTAVEMLEDHPVVHAALLAGDLDLPRARLICDTVRALDPRAAGRWSTG